VPHDSRSNSTTKNSQSCLASAVETREDRMTLPAISCQKMSGNASQAVTFYGSLFRPKLLLSIWFYRILTRFSPAILVEF